MLTTVNEISPLSWVRADLQASTQSKKSLKDQLTEAFSHDLVSNVALMTLVASVAYLYLR